MRKLLEKIWWRNTWTRGTFPLIPVVIGIILVNMPGKVTETIGVAFIITAMGMLLWGFWHSIHEGSKLVDEECDKRGLK